MSTQYKVKVPPTDEMGSYTTIAKAGWNATVAQDALRDYNSARRHDGLKRISRMPNGTKYTKIRS